VAKTRSKEMKRLKKLKLSEEESLKEKTISFKMEGVGLKSKEKSE